MDLALELGSDVPFSVLGGTALGLGRGEQLSPLMTRGQFHWVFATAAGGPVHSGGLRGAGPAGQRRRRRMACTRPREVVSALIAGDAAALGRSLVNDLQEPAFTLRPTLRDVLDTGLRAGAVGRHGLGLRAHGGLPGAATPKPASTSLRRWPGWRRCARPTSPPDPRPAHVWSRRTELPEPS